MRQIGIYYVYILECSDKSYYIGVTNDLDKRVAQHNSEYYKGSYIHSRRPVVVKYASIFNNIREAIAFEKQLKGWSRRKKEALFDEDWDTIIELAKKRFK